MSGFWERLQQRSLPTETLRFPADRSAWDAAHERLGRAAVAVQDSLRRGGPSAEQVAERDAAQAAVDALVVDVWVVRALPPDQFEALRSEHPPKPDAKHGEDFDPAGFYPLLLAECVTGGGERFTPEQWQDLFTSGVGLTLGERNTLINTALTLNVGAPLVSEHVGKDSGPTRP